MCKLPGRHKQGGGHYYPALLRPSDCDHPGCNHEDIGVNDISGSDNKQYEADDLRLVLSSIDPCCGWLPCDRATQETWGRQNPTGLWQPPRTVDCSRKLTKNEGNLLQAQYDSTVIQP